MERIGSKTVFEGNIARVRHDEFRYPDGSVSEREIVEHPGAVAMVAHDDLHVYLVRQPREAVGEESLLELPAGKLDVPGESELDCAKRELAEEIGKGASEWKELKRFYTSPGFEEERLEVVAWPLAELDGAIEECRDAKSLIGLLLFRELRRS